MKNFKLSGVGLALGLFTTSAAFADFNPYTFFGNSNGGGQAQTGDISQNQQNNAPSTASPTPAVTISAAPTSVAPQYTVPAALNQPGSNVKPYAPTSASTAPQRQLVLAPSPTSSSPPPTFTPGLLPNTALLPTGGVIPSSSGSSDQGAANNILQKIDADIQAGNNQIGSHYTTESILDFNPNLQPTSSTFVSTDSGYSAFAGQAKKVSQPDRNGNYSGLNSTANNVIQTTALNPYADSAWMTNLAIASTPQLLRIIAIQQALMNYILSQQLLSQADAVNQNRQELEKINDNITRLNYANSIYLPAILKGLSNKSAK